MTGSDSMGRWCGRERRRKRKGGGERSGLMQAWLVNLIIRPQF